MIDTGTRYGERILTQNRSVEVMTKHLEDRWINVHGAPNYFSSDPEFQVSRLRKFLRLHEIQLRPRPARRHNKTGIIERNNGVFKSIFYRLAKKTPTSTAAELISRSSFMTNLFTGSSISPEDTHHLFSLSHPLV